MKDSLGRGAAFGVLTVVAERGLSFAALLLVARVLEAERFGLYVYLLAGLMPIQVMSDQGLEIAAVNVMSRQRRGQAETLGVLLLGRILVWVAIGLPVAAVILPALSGCDVATAIAASFGMLVGPSLPYRSVYRARGDLATAWRIAMADAVGTFLGAVLVLGAGGGVFGVFVARAAVGVVVTVGAARHAGVVPRVGLRRRRMLGRLAQAAWPLAANAALLTLIVRTGQLIAMTLVGSAAVGRLGAAARVAEMLSMLAEGVMMAAFPAMAARPGRAARVADDVAGVLGILVGWAVAVTVVGAGPIVSLLYGPDYTDASGVLAILAWGALVSAAGAIAFYRLIVGEQQHVLLRANAAAALIGVVVQIPLVWIAGIRGAAVGTVVTLVAGQALLCADRRARVAVAAAWRRILPAGLLAIGAIAAGRVVGGAWTGMLVAFLTFPVAAIVAGVVGERERRALAAVWSLVVRRVAGRDEDG